MAAKEESVKKCVYVSGKRGRQCRMQASKGSTYCGEHLIYDKTPPRKRIPCPLDPSHTVFEELLHKHLRICNAAKREQPAGYSRGVNKGNDHTPSATPTSALSSCPAEKLEELIKKVKLACEGHVIGVKEAYLPHPCLQDDLADPTIGAKALKHLTQQSSIVGHMGRCGLLDWSKVSCYVEFGAGRGNLTAAVHRAIQYSRADTEGAGGQKLHYVLVDKSTCRRKVDGMHRATEQLAGATCNRLHMDIVDLDLLGVEAIRGCGLVGVGKHLCGAATDLSLRCLMKALEGGVKDGCGQGVKVRGVAMAMCCHHRCVWEELVGQDLLTQQGFTREDFDLITHMSSWATCGRRPEAKPEGAAKGKRCGYIPHPNEGVGLMCKRLIDVARLHYLTQCGLRAELVYYVSRDTSLENVLLIATAD